MELSMSVTDEELNMTAGAKKIKLNNCRCLPGCFELSYGFVISTAPITDHLVMKPASRPDREFRYFK